ncbi:alpha/beta hydrolase [Rhodobacter sp. HX-7-19]|uniref:Alpha/beta hydrolase n=1 Tax=Paragemmobacter kunshanensis TaxID=2583234 RepID=A0A6M1TX33_9RHOB|nr:alpha/beta hydrolase [Rhodobacter kunshanensis]NGQ92898.1 alpha/beta hydrolase [Rhodobacter kunshanensis]
MTWNIETRPTATCTALRSGLWHPKGEAKALCLFLPGLGDSFEKRADVAARLAAQGHEVLSLDWCGQGGSGRLGAHPQAAHADDFARYGADAASVLRARGRPDVPLWVLAYSMGAAVALPLIGSGVLAPRAVTLVSPMLRIPLPIPETLALAGASLAVALGFGRTFAPGESQKPAMGTSSADVTDPACQLRVAELAADSPELSLRGVTWGWSRAALAAMRSARSVGWRKGPVLIATADQETSVDLSPVPDVARRLDARVVDLPGGHDLFLAGPATRDRLFAEISATVDPAIAGDRQGG